MQLGVSDPWGNGTMCDSFDRRYWILVFTVLFICGALVGCEPKVTSGETETVMLPGNVPLEMVRIPAGTFLMGRYPGEKHSSSNEDPQHEVTLTQGCWMAKYELTKAQWTAGMGATPWSGGRDVSDDPDSPAVYVSWNAVFSARNGTERGHAPSFLRKQESRGLAGSGLRMFSASLLSQG